MLREIAGGAAPVAPRGWSPKNGKLQARPALCGSSLGGCRRSATGALPAAARPATALDSACLATSAIPLDSTSGADKLLKLNGRCPS